MLFVTHLAVGLALGRRLRHPAAATAAGVLSHLLLDRIPHWDGFDGTAPWTARRNLAAVIGDVAAAAAIISLALARRWVTRDRPGVTWGAVGAVLPDLLWVPYHVVGLRWPRRLFMFHGRIQRSARWQPSLVVQLALIGLCLRETDRG
jgi:hypothetical protein